jgi:hypothetical protein
MLIKATDRFILPHLSWTWKWEESTELGPCIGSVLGINANWKTNSVQRP